MGKKYSFNIPGDSCSNVCTIKAPYQYGALMVQTLEQLSPGISKLRTMQSYQQLQTSFHKIVINYQNIAGCSSPATYNIN